MKLVLTGAHELDPTVLRTRIEERVAHYAERYPKAELGALYHWLSDRHAHADYRGGVADLHLGERDLRVELELPFFARLYQRRIEEFVQNEIATVTGQPVGAPRT